MARIVVNPETLSALKTSFSNQSIALETLTAALQSDVDSTHAEWQGHVADTFRTDWATQFAPMLKRLSEALVLAGNDVDTALRNALAADGQA